MFKVGYKAPNILDHG